MLDLRGRAAGEYWSAIIEAVRRLDGRHHVWRLTVRVADTPEVAQELPHVLRQLEVVHLEHQVTRQSGGAQTGVLTRKIRRPPAEGPREQRFTRGLVPRARGGRRPGPDPHRSVGAAERAGQGTR
ncbi:MAG TPA: hypothetical protein VFN74_00505 [Chloroflexota bacterium]|nr:hypothetical protein [Chloroflexota bacterium]